jgi:hypothetical protein
MIARGQMKLMLGGWEDILSRQYIRLKSGSHIWPHRADTFCTVSKTFTGKSITSLYSYVELREEPVNSELYD